MELLSLAQRVETHLCCARNSNPTWQIIRVGSLTHLYIRLHMSLRIDFGPLCSAFAMPNPSIFALRILDFFLISLHWRKRRLDPLLFNCYDSADKATKFLVFPSGYLNLQHKGTNPATTAVSTSALIHFRWNRINPPIVSVTTLNLGHPDESQTCQEEQ